MFLLLPLLFPLAPLVLEGQRLLGLLHVLVEVEGDFPLERVPNELIIFVDDLDNFAVEVGEKVGNCWCQHLTLLKAITFKMWPHAFDEFSEI